MSYRHTYAMLKRAGHTPAKAAEIVLDASRGDRHALRWVVTAFPQSAARPTSYRGRRNIAAHRREISASRAHR